MDIVVQPFKGSLKGIINTPPDKSISHRAIMFASLANGKSIIRNFLNGADCLSTASIFKKLGVNIDFIDENSLVVQSNGHLAIQDKILDCGNSGTSMRLISGILAGQTFDSILIGDESLSKRPMKRIITPLSMMGADIQSNNYKAPLHIKGKQLHGIEYTSPIASAQVKSSILLAGMNAEGETTVIEPYKSRNHTEIMLGYMGANIIEDGNKVSITKSELTPCEINVAGDISSAAFFIVAALIIPNSEIILKNVGLNPTRTGILDIVNRMGGLVEMLDERIISGETVGDIRIRYSELKGCTISGEDIPRLIDELPIIALLATQASGVTTVKDAGDLRNKEADRISAIVTEFRKLGIEIDELPDGFIITGKQIIKGNTEVEVYKDHRLAMTFYIASLLAQKEVLIKEFDWVNVSMPSFLQTFAQLSNN